LCDSFRSLDKKLRIFCQWLFCKLAYQFDIFDVHLDKDKENQIATVYYGKLKKYILLFPRQKEEEYSSSKKFR
jgi:hypothetical protein